MTHSVCHIFHGHDYKAWKANPLAFIVLSLFAWIPIRSGG